MSDFNIDDVLSQFGSKTSSPTQKKEFDIDSILKEFHGTEEVPAAKADTGRIYVGPPSAPISEARPQSNSEALPVEKNPPLTSEGAYEHYKAGREMISGGLEDLQTGHPYKGIGKTALGALGIVGSPV